MYLRSVCASPAAATKAAVDVLARALDANEDGRMIVDMLRYENRTPVTQCYNPAYVDTYDLARRVRDAEFGDELTQAVEAVDTLIVASFGFGGFEAGKHGVYLVTPTAPRPATARSTTGSS